MGRNGVLGRWFARVGYAFVVLGGLLLWPLGDFLPVELSLPISSWFQPHASHRFFRLVPAGSGQTPAYVSIAVTLIAVGILLVLAAWTLQRKE